MSRIIFITLKLHYFPIIYTNVLYAVDIVLYLLIVSLRATAPFQNKKKIS